MTVTTTLTATFHPCNRLKYQTKRDKDVILVSKRLYILMIDLDVKENVTMV